MEAIAKSRNAGFKKFSIDLIYGFPKDNHAIWEKDLGEAIRQDPGHISAYSLTIEPKTAWENGQKREVSARLRRIL